MLLGLVGLAALIVALSTLVLSASIFEGFAERGWWTDEMEGQGRIDLWRATWMGLMESPWLGLGPAGAETAMNRFSIMPNFQAPVWSHNDYVQMISELGLPVAALCLAVLLAAVYAFARDWAAGSRRIAWSEGLLARAATVGVVVALAHAVTDFHLRIPLVGFSFLILLAVVAMPALRSNRFDYTNA
jgi:O-antigen ligase